MKHRWVAAAVVVLLVLLASVVLLADRAPVVYEQVVDRSFEVAAHVRDAVGLEDDDIGREDIPVGDKTGGHIILFAGATAVAAFVFRHRFSPWVVALTVLAASALLEVIQPMLSSSREQEWTDLVANASGVAIGWVVVSLVLRIPRLRRSRSLAW